MQRVSGLPFLPGFNFDQNLGRENFHRNQYFMKIHDGVYYCSEKMDVGDPVSYPSIYPRGEAQELPPWIAYDGQRLMFKAYFQETVHERWKTSYQIRVVNISFFLEDGTMKISEPSVNNSGLEQGVFLRRQRIPMPGPASYRFYDIIDLNINKEVEIYGRVYKIVDCDKFTRIFLNRMGIPVPDPTKIPKDPYLESRKSETFPKKPNRRIDTRGDFIKYDKQVLRFYGYWDDTESLYGFIHDLEIYYYLSDGTIEVKENISTNSGRDSGSMFLRRMKVPKYFDELEPIGAQDPFTVLNVMGISNSYTIDPLGSGKSCKEFYKDNDLCIGAEINIFGRKIGIIDMDPFTKEYYRKKYGLDFTPLERPRKDEEVCRGVEKYIPPYNGYGTYEDSLGNCFSVLPKPPKMDVIKFIYYDKQGFDSRVLRFRAKLISNIPENEDRAFIIRFYLMNDSISIFELAKRNSGFRRCVFQKRMPVMLPNQDIFVSKKPDYYKPQDFYIGARINLNCFIFEILGADDYALRYMELHSDEYPRANVKLIMDKLRNILEPVYKEFVQTYAPAKSNDNDLQILPYETFRQALLKYSKEKIVEHEIITLARHFTCYEKKETRDREYIRRIVHTEILRNSWDELDRLEEDLHHCDRMRSGFLPRQEIFTVLRGSRIPVDIELINSMLNCICENDEGKLDYNDLLRLMNIKIDPVAPLVPLNIKHELWWAAEKQPNVLDNINWCAFLKELNLEEEEKDIELKLSDAKDSSIACNKFIK